MMKRTSIYHSKKVTAYNLLSILFLLTSCGGDVTKSSSSIDSTEPVKDYFDSENFVTPEKEVTTSKLVTYEGPKMMESSKKVSVKVNGEDLFVYETRSITIVLSLGQLLKRIRRRLYLILRVRFILM